MMETIRPKRHRHRYLQIRNQVRRATFERKVWEAEKLQIATTTATIMSLIRSALDLPTPEDELKYIDNTILKQYPTVTPAWVESALRYLNGDFTPLKLYGACMKYYSDPNRIWEWLRVRWAIIEAVEGRANHDIIPANYYSFRDEDFFFTDEVINTVGHNYLAWKLKPKPKKFDPSKDVPAREMCNESSVVVLTPWQRFVKWVTCKTN